MVLADNVAGGGSMASTERGDQILWSTGENGKEVKAL